MNYTKEIHIYVLNYNFNVPLASSPNNHIQMKNGDTLITIDNVVYVEYKNRPNTEIENFIEASFKKGFIDINPTIFKLKV